MDVIPVLDLMRGQVVQGDRGRRDRYRPIESDIVAGSEPVSVAHALHRETACPAIYLADLDALMGVGDHHATIGALGGAFATGLWVDAGADAPEVALEILAAGATRVIVGTETLPSIQELSDIAAVLSAGRLLVSLDIGGGGVISPCPELRGRRPLEALELLADTGMDSVILLSLDQVGTGAGPDLATLRAIGRAFPSLALVAGGGVRTPDDLRALSALGVDAVLLATALHRRWITSSDLRALELRD